MRLRNQYNNKKYKKYTKVSLFGEKSFCVCCDLDPHSRLCVLSRASGIQGYLWVAPGPTHFIVVMHKALFLFNL